MPSKRNTKHIQTSSTTETTNILSPLLAKWPYISIRIWVNHFWSCSRVLKLFQPMLYWVISPSYAPFLWWLPCGSQTQVTRPNLLIHPTLRVLMFTTSRILVFLCAEIYSFYSPFCPFCYLFRYSYSYIPLSISLVYIGNRRRRYLIIFGRFHRSFFVITIGSNHHHVFDDDNVVATLV